MADISKGTTIRIDILPAAATVEYISNSCQEKRPPRLSYNKMFFNELTTLHHVFAILMIAI